MPYSWITPVTDRDYYRDVYVAQSELNKKKQNISYEIGFLKGCLNYTDLNRIENNMHVLAEMLSVSIAESTIWSNVSIPTNSEQSRILGSAVTVRSAFISKYPEMEEIESVPPLLLNWENFNQLERLQLTMYEKITEPQSYDETKIAVVKLDENMQKTDDIHEFDYLYKVGAYLSENPDSMYHLRGGKKCTNIIPNWYSDFIAIDNLYSVDIPDGVTELTASAFQRCHNLVSVNLPDSIETFDESDSMSSGKLGEQFANCTSLASVKLPNKLKEIPSFAFSGCTSLKSIIIPDSVTEIKRAAFSDCTSLESVIIGKGVTAINVNGANNTKNGSFYGCTSLKEIVIPGNVKIIGHKNNMVNATFTNCTSLKKVVIESGVEEINEGYTFSGCTSLETVEIQEGIKEIGFAAFEDCENLKSISLPDSIIDLGSYNESSVGRVKTSSSLFARCKQLKYVKLPKNLRELGSSIFFDCSALETVVMPEHTSGIGSSAFYNCASLKNINIPDGVKFIDAGFSYGTFENCNVLKSIVLPDSIEEIGSGAFKDCSNLITVKMPKFLRYIGRNVSGVYSNVTGVFSNCESLKSIVIPSNVRDIPGGTFSGCSSLLSINVSNRYKTIESDPWGAPNFISTSYAESLTEHGKPIPAGKHVVTWGAEDSEEEKALFAQSAKLSEINADGVTVSYSISKNFDGIREILQENPDKNYDIVLGEVFNMDGYEHVHDIPADCFAGMSNFKSVYIPQKFSEIADNAFSGCTGLEYIEIGRTKGEISGGPWGAPAGTVIYYSAELVTENGGTLTGDEFFTVRTTGSETVLNTKLSGILKVDSEPAEPVEKTLYILSENGKFGLKLGNKELRR